MTVAPRLQAEDLAEVFEHLGSACTKLSQIMKRQQQAGTGRPKKSKAPIQVAEAVEATAASVSEAAAVVADVFEPPVVADVPESTEDLSKLTKVVGSKRKPVRDPSAPKRPLTAFILFCMERRPIIMAAHPGLSFKEVATMMSKDWETVDQKPYYERAADLKKNYYEERATYMQGKASEQVEKAASPKNEAAVSGEPATPQPAKTPKKRTPSVKRSRLEDLPEPATPINVETVPVAVEPEVVLTQELIPETTTPVAAAAAVPVVEGEKKEKKKRKKVSDVTALVAPIEPVQQPVSNPVPEIVKLPESLPQTQPTEPVITTTTTTTGEPEKKKKKKKKVAVDNSDAVSQASSTPAGLLSTQPIHIQ